MWHELLWGRFADPLEDARAGPLGRTLKLCAHTCLPNAGHIACDNSHRQTPYLAKQQNIHTNGLEQHTQTCAMFSPHTGDSHRQTASQATRTAGSSLCCDSLSSWKGKWSVCSCFYQQTTRLAAVAKCSLQLLSTVYPLFILLCLSSIPSLSGVLLRLVLCSPAPFASFASFASSAADSV